MSAVPTARLSAGQRALRIALPILVLGLGAAVFALLFKTKPEAEKQPRSDQGALVEVLEVRVAKQRVRVSAQGTVIPARQIVVQPEVTGRVVRQSSELVPGGRFKKGQTIVRIDARDYSLAAKQQNANVDRARLELELERSRQQIAKREWQIIGEDANATPEGRSIALRKPHVRVAEANVAAAKSARSTARLRLGRTRIVAPFNAMVTAEAVDVGQLVSPQTPLATLAGTDEFWVQISIPMDKVATLDVPGVGATAEGSAAVIWQEVSGRRVERAGRVIRLLGDVDPVGRMARLLIEIDDPLGLSNGAGTASKEEVPSKPIPILLGSYVQVEIEGDTLQEVIEVPRRALREGDRIYVEKDGRLVIRDVSVVWRRPETVLVGRGLKSGDRVVLSRLATPVDGMALRSQTTKTASKAP